MNIKQSFIVFVLLGAMLSGCKTSEKKQFTDWSIPTVKLLPHSKNEKVTPPAEKANAKATANLAHDRLNGHNPTAAIRDNNDDPTLRPDPQEVAQLSSFEGRQIPDWANSSTLPPGPEAASPAAAERVAQNVTDQTIQTAQATTPSALPQQAGTQTPQTGLPSSPTPSNTLAQVPAASNIYDGNLPASLDDLPAPAASAPQEQFAGSTMTELPAEIPAGSVAPATVSNTPVPAQTQSKVLFMPGNINPQYPQGPVRN